jgi:hypothetical protein
MDVPGKLEGKLHSLPVFHGHDAEHLVLTDSTVTGEAEVRFFQGVADRYGRSRIGHRGFHGLFRQKPYDPARPALRGVRTGGRDQARLEITVELDRRRRRLAMLPPQGRLLAPFDKPLL